MAEVSRLSDAEDHITLVLTERGTLVIELAREIQKQFTDGLQKLKTDSKKEEGALSAQLQRSIAHHTERIVGQALQTAGVGREHRLGDIDITQEGKDLVRSSCQFSTEN